MNAFSTTVIVVFFGVNESQFVPVLMLLLHTSWELWWFLVTRISNKRRE